MPNIYNSFSMGCSSRLSNGVSTWVDAGAQKLMTWISWWACFARHQCETLAKWKQLVWLIVFNFSGLTSQEVRLMPFYKVWAVPQVPRKRVKPLPSLPVRMAQALHMPKKDDIKNATRCRNPGCSKKTQHCCTSCDIYLCTETDWHCFFDFRTKKRASFLDQYHSSFAILLPKT